VLATELLLVKAVEGESSVALPLLDDAVVTALSVAESVLHELEPRPVCDASAEKLYVEFADATNEEKVNGPWLDRVVDMDASQNCEHGEHGPKYHSNNQMLTLC
jgi:hypothetical protein